MLTDDIEAIKQLKARYFRTMDTKDWDGHARRCSPTTSPSTPPPPAAASSPAPTSSWPLCEKRSTGAVTVHQGHMPEIELTSPTTATGVWALNDIILWPNGTRLDGYGHYHETYEKAGDGWRIKSLTLTRLHTDVTPPTE